MKHQLLEVEKERFYLNDPCCYVIRGVIPEKYHIEAFLDGRKLEASMERQIAKSAVERFKDGEMLGGQRVEAVVSLPADLNNSKRLDVFAVFENNRLEWFHVKTAELMRRREKPQY